MSKEQARSQALEHRRAMGEAERIESAEAIAAHLLEQPIIARAKRVAAYVAMASEPGTAPAIAGLLARGIEVIVPISLEDHSLDWVAFLPEATQTTTALGITELEGVRLGASALATVDLVIVPALAVDVDGHRLGRGAGYYDRALASATAPICALLFAGEIADEVPHEPHDIPVHMVITPTGVFRVP